MPSFGKFLIELDDGLIFEPGQDINGCVKIVCDNEGDELEELIVIVRGIVGTHSKLEGNVSAIPIEEIVFLSEETLFEETLQLVPKGQHILEKQNIYKFSFHSPDKELPANLTGHHGRVYYRIVAKCSRVSPNNSVFTAKDIYFRGKVDLSKDPANAVPPPPLAREKVLTSCFCCGQGSIAFDISTDKTGYLPGEEIICILNVHNTKKPKAPLRKIHVMLNSVVTYIIQDKTIYDGKNHTTHDGPSVQAEETIEAIKIVLSVPHEIPPSGLKACKLIDIAYMIEVTMTNVSDADKIEMTGSIPIVIGTCRE